jgi:glucosylceramidase
MRTGLLQKRCSSASRAVLVVIFCCASVLAQKVQLYVSSQAGDRLAAKPAERFDAGAPAPQALKFEINDQVTYQRITGFGASFMEAGLMVINTLPPQQQEEVLRAMFDPQQGAGFTAMKTPIASTDFMSAGPFYSYDPVPGDVEMKHFSIARDLGPNGVITYIKRGRRYGQFVLQAPMDYPPDWMLFNPDTNQDVNPRYYDALASYYLRYLQEYQKNGVFIDYLSLFNEPGVYTKIPYGEIRILLGDYVGPSLEKSGLRTRLMLSESGDRDDAFTNYPLIMDDHEARKYIAVMPYHGYGFKEYSKMAELHRRYPEAPLWMTEVCYAYQSGTPKTLSLPVYDFADGDFWGQEIFSDLENYASAWIYWNAVLDEKGGPWSVSYIHGNPDPNVQHPVIIINRQTHKVTYTGLYYYLAHFSKFVRPGAVRIETNGNYPGVRAISFNTPEGKIVSELMNSRKEEVEVAIVANGHTLPLKLPAVSITTAVW